MQWFLLGLAGLAEVAVAVAVWVDYSLSGDALVALADPPAPR